MDEPNVALTCEQQTRVEHAVAHAASQTSAKIIPIISPRSGRYDRAEDMIGLWAAAVGLVLTWLVLSLAPIGKEFATGGSISGIGGLVPVLASVIVGFGVGAVLATKIGSLRRMFIPKAKMARAVSEHAKQYFADHFLTCDSQGDVVLVYVSMYERTATLLTSEKLKGRLSTVELESIRADIEKSIHDGSVTDGVCTATARIAELLAPHCPPKLVESTRKKSFVKIIG